MLGPIRVWRKYARAARGTPRCTLALHLGETLSSLDTGPREGSFLAPEVHPSSAASSLGSGKEALRRCGGVRGEGGGVHIRGAVVLVFVTDG